MESLCNVRKSSNIGHNFQRLKSRLESIAFNQQRKISRLVSANAPLFFTRREVLNHRDYSAYKRRNVFADSLGERYTRDAFARENDNRLHLQSASALGIAFTAGQEVSGLDPRTLSTSNEPWVMSNGVIVPGKCKYHWPVVSPDESSLN